MPESQTRLSRDLAPTPGAATSRSGNGPETQDLYSIIIAVYNDWNALQYCLKSISEQTNAPRFEVIVVDDGSEQPAPEFIRRWIAPFPLTILRQAHAGPAAARNNGARASRGSVLVFSDADSRIRPDCLSALESAAEDFPQDQCFQLRLIGDRSCLAGRAEDLRLLTLQRLLLSAEGRIRYLNTAGFAMRRQSMEAESGIFNTSVRRGEDTVLLASLMQKGELPRFVSEAVVQHAISLPLARCLLKDIRSGWHERQADREIASSGIRIRMEHHERLRVLRSMWIAAGDPSLGRAAYFTLLARQLLERLASHVLGRLGRQASKSKTGRPPVAAAN